MSLTFESFEMGALYIEYCWDKYAPHYIAFAGRKQSDGLVHTISERRYATREQAKRAYRRLVLKAKRGELS